MEHETIAAVVQESRAAAGAAVASALIGPVQEYNSLLAAVQISQTALIAQLEALRSELAAAVAKAPHAGSDNNAAQKIATLEAATQRIESLRHRINRVSETLQFVSSRVATLQGAVTVYEQQQLAASSQS